MSNANCANKAKGVKRTQKIRVFAPREADGIRVKDFAAL
jgi:hypothetical protein